MNPDKEAVERMNAQRRLNMADGITSGPIKLADLDLQGEAFFYTPTVDADFKEPMVFAVYLMHDPVHDYVNAFAASDCTLPPPDGLELTMVQIDPGYAQHLINTGSAERPLIDMAKAQHANGRGGIVYYAASTEIGAPENHAVLIDGVHRYCAAHELGETKIMAAMMREPFYSRFLVGGIPFAAVRRMQGSGPEETGRHDFETSRGYREKAR